MSLEFEDPVFLRRPTLNEIKLINTRITVSKGQDTPSFPLEQLCLVPSTCKENLLNDMASKALPTLASFEELEARTVQTASGSPARTGGMLT